MVAEITNVRPSDPIAPSPPPPRQVRASTRTERALTTLLSEFLQVEHLTPDSNFFDDLGADSMVVARFCARLRKRTDLPSVSVKDVYQHRTISSLANALATDVPADGPTTVAEKPATRTTEPARRARTGEYLLCGALQLLLYLIYSSAGIVVVIRGYEWVAAGHTLLDEYLRSVVFGAAALVVLATFPILAKWVLIGRWKPKQIRVWSLGYLRFWIVKTLIRSNPLVLLTGGRSHTSTSSPLHVLYLKALGAKIGRGVAIYSRHVPVCTDLLSIGDGAVVRKDALINCYRAHDGMIQTGAVTLGTDAFVGEATIIDIDSSLGDGSQLGHSSSLHNGQNVPDGECISCRTLHYFIRVLEK